MWYFKVADFFITPILILIPIMYICIFIFKDRAFALGIENTSMGDMIDYIADKEEEPLNRLKSLILYTILYFLIASISVFIFAYLWPVSFILFTLYFLFKTKRL